MVKMKLTAFIQSCVIVILYQLYICYGHGHSPNTHQNSATNQHATHANGKVDIDPEHIKEHLDGVADMPKDMTTEELEFHYFKLHDIDNNTKLDGLEIYKALTHFMPYDDVDDEDKIPIDTVGKTPTQIAEAKKEAIEKYYMDIVDNVLREDDIDEDGYITYLEFVLAKRREEIKERQAEKQNKQQQQRDQL